MQDKENQSPAYRDALMRMACYLQRVKSGRSLDNPPIRPLIEARTGRIDRYI